MLLGDAEMNEGSNHEALAFAGRMGLESLTVVVIDNRSATHGWPGGLTARFASEGWRAESVNGRDHDALERAFTTAFKPALHPPGPGRRGPLLDALLGRTVHVPGHPEEVEPLLRHAASGDGRVHVRLSLQTNPAPLPSSLGISRSCAVGREAL